MDKTYRTQRHRIFLIDALPEPLTRSSRHLQILDNYIENTRIRLRSVRDLDISAWTWVMQQIIYPDAQRLSPRKFSEIHLNEAEFAQFRIFEGNEIRKNRYFHEFDGRLFSFDVFLGEMWGLNIAKAAFDNEIAFEGFIPPPFAVMEITENSFFRGANLARQSFADARAEAAKCASAAPTFCGSDEQ